MKNNRDYRNNRKTSKAPLFMAALLFLTALGAGGYYIGKKLLPNFKQIPFYAYYQDLDPDKLYLVLGEERLDTENNPVIKDDTLYLPVDFVKNCVDKYIFWDKKANRLTITTENKVIRMRTEELSYYVNDKPMDLNLPLYQMDGLAYLPDRLLEELYNIQIQYDPAFNMIMIDYKDIERSLGQVTAKKTNLRYEPDKKSPFAETLVTGTTLTLYEEIEGYTRVRTENGLLGYVLTKDIEKTGTLEPVIKEEPPLSTPHKKLPKIDGKINLLWDQMLTIEASANPSRRQAYKGLSVICPTWFSFDFDTLNGDILHIADKGYVDWAHGQGYQVWALIKDFNEADGLAKNEIILASTENREHIIRQLLAFIAMYDLDGINVDFEKITAETAPYYLQLLRELAPFMKEQGAILSVDMYVPKPWSMFYNRTEVGKVVDYIAVMTYDEHTASKEYGPVASLGFVEEGIVETLKEVPKEKILMGLPFYVRVWAEEEAADGTLTYSRDNYRMEAAYNNFKKNGAEFTWLEEIGSYYAEYTLAEGSKKTTYRVWLEDERSIEEKMKLFQKYDLAGVASWKKGLEKPEAWDAIVEHLR